MFYEAAVTNLTNDNQPIAAFRDVSNSAASYHAMGHAIGGSAEVFEYGLKMLLAVTYR